VKTNVFLGKYIQFLILRFCNRHEVHTVVCKRRVCTMQSDRNRRNRAISGEFGEWTTGLQTLF